MLRIHTADGRTKTIDLKDASQAKDWLPVLQQPRSATVTGLGLVSELPLRIVCPTCQATHSVRKPVQVSIPRPQGFRTLEAVAEVMDPDGRVKGGERLTVFSDNLRIVLMAHAEQPSIRISVANIGHRRFNPLSHGVSEHD